LKPIPPSEPLRPRSLGRTIRDHVVLLSAFLGAMWIVEILELLPFVHLDRFGIHPRTVSGLWGILTSPFLHADFRHLILNSLPFVVFGGTVLLSGVRVFWAVTLFVMMAGGFGVWLLAPSATNHIGASGLIFGYLGFLLARGLFDRSLWAMLVAVVILVVYGGLLFGVLPSESGISWQGHLFGFLAGAVAAWLASSIRNAKV
jgi:membrane associated rhomboid family serine protease